MTCENNGTVNLSYFIYVTENIVIEQRGLVTIILKNFRYFLPYLQAD
jgi:hypothetical protein